MTICIVPGCPDIVERAGAARCPQHDPGPWAGSKRRSRVTLSGTAEQARARRILARYRRICHVCELPGATEVDHVIPLSEGGPDTEANLRPIHGQPCHATKTANERARARWPNRTA